MIAFSFTSSLGKRERIFSKKPENNEHDLLQNEEMLDSLLTEEVID